MPKVDVKCEAEEDEDDVTFQYDKLVRASPKAVLLKLDGDKHWIPFSQVVAHYPDSDEIRITNWIAEQKGLA